MDSTEMDEFLCTFSLPPGFPGNSNRHETKYDLLPNALEAQWSRPLVTLREFEMMKVMDSITDKPNWNEKVFDDKITDKWRAEIAESKALNVSEKMMNFIIAEVKYKAKVFDKIGAVVAYDAGIVKSDSVISETLKLELRAAAAKLEDVPEDAKDWHPGSNGQVLDLVHPSLYPLVFSQTRVVSGQPISVADALSRTGEGVVLPKFGESDPLQGAQWSYNYQWLPCEVAIKSQEGLDEEKKDGSGDYRCEIASYINNLHPRDHRELYGIIQRIMTRVLPLWNMTLSPLKEKLITKVRIEVNGPLYASDEETPDQLEGENDDDHWQRTKRWRRERLLEPEPEDFEAVLPEMERMHGGGEVGDIEDENEAKYCVVNLCKNYGRMQVIVKLANIHLTPEKPEYPGGSWHVEGQQNERICATALYYYDSENISESRLAFRQLSDADDIDFEYEQEEHEWLEAYFGCKNHEPAIQDVGSIECKEGRLLTFPNIYMHKVLPFRLADAAKPGHRKILALFLVDPKAEVLSTAQVPPQRRDWWERETKWQQVIGRLPLELQMMVDEQRDGAPFSEAQAKKIREKLMDERKLFVKEADEAWKDSTSFSLCEH